MAEIPANNPSCPFQIASLGPFVAEVEWELGNYVPCIGMTLKMGLRLVSLWRQYTSTEHPMLAFLSANMTCISVPGCLSRSVAVLDGKPNQPV